MDSQSGLKQANSTRVRRPSKRIKLEESPSPKQKNVEEEEVEVKVEVEKETDRGMDIDEDEDHQHNCSICLQHLVDRTVIPSCSHEFCFECILVWTGMEPSPSIHIKFTVLICSATEQSRRCPLCSQAMSDYLIHRIRSKYDYQKHYLTPIRTSPSPLRPNGTVRRQTQRRERQWGRRQLQEMEEADELERAIAKRRWIYEHALYAKVSHLLILVSSYLFVKFLFLFVS